MEIRKQAFINTVGNIVYLFSLLALTAVTSHCLGYTAAGTLTLAMAVGNVIAVIQMSGVRSFQSSDILFQYSAREYVLSRIITILFGWGIGILACVILRYPVKITCSIILFILLKTSESFSDVLFGNDQRVGHLEYGGYSMLARGIVIITAFSITAIFARNLNTALFAAGVGGVILSLTVDLPVHNKTAVINKSSQCKGAFNIIKDCFPLMIVTLIPTVIAGFPRIILERYNGPEILGYYGNVSTPSLLLTSVMPTILVAFLPGFGKAAGTGDYRTIRTNWVKTLCFVIALTICSILGVYLLGKPVLSIIYTDKIIPYIQYLYSIFIAMAFCAFTMCNNTVLVALRKNWGLSFTSILALIICLICTTPLVREWGIPGAIASLGIPYAIQFIVQTIWILLICRNGNNNETTTS